MSKVKVSKVSLLSTYILAVWFDYQQFLVMGEILRATEADPEQLVQFVAAVIAALEERDDAD